MPTRGKGKAVVAEPTGRIWPLEADVLRDALERASEERGGLAGLSAEVKKTVKGLLAEEADVVLWVGDDGVTAVRSILVSSTAPTATKSSKS